MCAKRLRHSSVERRALPALPSIVMLGRSRTHSWVDCDLLPKHPVPIYIRAPDGRSMPRDPKPLASRARLVSDLHLP